MPHAPLPDPGADPAIQDFLQHLSSHRSRGVRATSEARVEPLIVKRKVIQEYVQKADHSKRLLQAVLKVPPGRVRTDEIWKYHTIVFAILVRIGKGEYIDHCSRNRLALSDQALPFLARPANFPVPTNDLDFYDAFVREQWQFCPHDFRGDTDLRIEQGHILPIISCCEIGRGGSAIAYRIEIDPEYDHLCEEKVEEDDDANSLPSRRASRSQKSSSKVYVLKTYNTQDAESYYNSEIDAFRRLQEGGTSYSNIIGYHGSFRKGDTFNVLLEYADGNGAKNEDGEAGHTLEHYFQTVDPPTHGRDILLFWKRLFDVVKGLRCIHTNEEESQITGGPSIFQGWHQDVKPSNILVCSRHSNSTYDCDFKLADLGLSHFRKIENQDPGTDTDTQGSQIYGAPECYRDSFLEKGKLKVKPLVDIWSLGCVFSEAAVWLVLGKNELHRYYQLRHNEADTIHGFQHHGCFHNGHTVLDSVGDMHQKVIDSVRSLDFVTKAVVGSKRNGTTPPVKGLVTEMLTTQDRRPKAEMIWGNAEEIVREAEAALEEAMKDQSSSLRSKTLPTVSRPPPPVLPHSANSDQTGNHSEPRELNSNFDERVPRREPRLSTETNGLHDSPVTGSPASQKSPPASPPSVEKDVRHKHKSSNSESTGEPSSPSRTKVTTSHHRDQSMDQESPNGLGLAFRCPNSPENLVPITKALQMVQEEPYQAAVPFIKESPALPRRDVQSLMLWLHEKQQKPFARLSEEERPLLTLLEKRDYVFLIDDAMSMQKYWGANNLHMVFAALFGLLVPYDDNGIDIYFTMSRDKHNYKNSQQATDFLGSKRPSSAGTSDVSLRLGAILEEYCEELEKNIRNRKRALIGMLTKKKKPLTVFVLTDAVWQPRSDEVVAQIIRNTVKTLNELKKSSYQIGVEFIQFGNNQHCKKKLEVLDSGLGLKPDIVDAEASDGNVWKILLGSTNKMFDDDSETPPATPRGPWS